MTHELRRPFLFSVQQTKRPRIGIVPVVAEPDFAQLFALDSVIEQAAVDQVEVTGGDRVHAQDERHESERKRTHQSDFRRRTMGALPLVFSPRPSKQRHISVSAPSPVPDYHHFQPQPPASARNASVTQSGLAKRRGSTAKCNSSRMTLAPLTNQASEAESAFDVNPISSSESEDVGDKAMFPEPVRLLQPPPLVTSFATRNLLDDDVAPEATVQPTPPPKLPGADQRVPAVAATTPAIDQAQTASATANESFAVPFIVPQDDKIPKFEESEKPDVQSPSLTFKVSISNNLQVMGERTITRHVMRGKYLRKFLHVKHLARKMKDTEMLLRTRQLSSVQDPTVHPDDEKVDSTAKLLTELKQELPSFRRLVSLDQRSDDTVQRIRQLSGLDKLVLQETEKATDKKHASIASLGAVVEQSGSVYRAEWEVKGKEELSQVVNPSSAHFFQICRHVIAKHTIAMYMRQECSIVTQIEHKSRKPTRSVFSTKERIKDLHADVIHAARVYLRDSDLSLTVEELYQEALDAELSRRWKRAILLASACIVVDHESILPSLLRARCCRQIGLWNQAIKDLSNAILRRNDDFKLFLQRGFLYLKLLDLDNGLADATRALGLYPRSIEALLLRAELFSRRANLQAAFLDLATALIIDPRCWRAFYDRATLRLRGIEGDEENLMFHWETLRYEGLLASIIDDYMNALRYDCHIVEVAETIGDLTVRLYEYTNDPNVLRHVIRGFSDVLIIHTQTSSAKATRAASTAEELQQQLLQSQRNTLVAALLAQRGRLHALLRQITSALSDFDEASLKESDYAVSHFYRGTLGCLISKEKDLTGAYAGHLSRCITLDPTIAGAYVVRGSLHLRDLKFSNALHDFKAAVSADPTLCDVWMQIALIYLNHYHDCEACSYACTNALANDPTLIRALYVRAEAATRQGELLPAIRDYARISHFQPQDRWAVLMRGRLLLQLRQYRPALYSFISFLELGSSNEHHLALLCGRAYKILNRFASAVRMLQKAVTLHPSAENLVLLSESLHAMGDTENSLRISEQVINSAPASHRGHIRKAQLLVSIGQWEAAMQEYTCAIQLTPQEPRIYYERGIVLLQLYKNAVRKREVLRRKASFVLPTEDLAAPSSSSTAGPSEGPPVVSGPEGSTKAPGGFPAGNPQTSDANGDLNKEQHEEEVDEPLTALMDITSHPGSLDEAQQDLCVRTYYAACINDFSKCIRFGPLFADAYVDRAEMYLNGEDYSKAFRDLEYAVELNPKCARAHVNLGVLKCHFMAFASAIVDFDRAIRHDPKLALAFFNRGVCYHRLSLWAQAEASYSESISIWGDDRNADAHRNRGIARCQLDDYEGALMDFEAVRQVAPDDEQLHGGMGYVLLQLGRGEEAAKCFATFGRLSRDTCVDSGNVYYNLGSSQLHAQVFTGPYHHQLDEPPLEETKHVQYLKTALRMYIRAARIDPMNPNIRLNIANCLRLLRHEQQAIDQCTMILQQSPHAHPAIEGKALALCQIGQFDRAIEQLDEAIRLCVGLSPGLENVFYAFSSDSLHRHALERKRGSTGRFAVPVDAMTISPSESMPYGGKRKRKSQRQYVEEIALYGSSRQMLALYLTNRGVLYEKTKNWNRARENYRDAIFFDPQSLHGHFCLGTLELLQHNYLESIQCFQKVIEVHPTSGITHINLGVAYMLVGDKNNALNHLDTALNLLPNCSYAHANKAVVLANSGAMKDAEMLLKRAIIELPSHHGFYVAKGRLIAQQKRLQDAMVDFSTALHLGFQGKL